MDHAKNEEALSMYTEMLIEDFLRHKKYSKTLQMFDRERSGIPHTSPALVSFADIRAAIMRQGNDRSHSNSISTIEALVGSITNDLDINESARKTIMDIPSQICVQRKPEVCVRTTPPTAPIANPNQSVPRMSINVSSNELQKQQKPPTKLGMSVSNVAKIKDIQPLRAHTKSRVQHPEAVARTPPSRPKTANAVAFQTPPTSRPSSSKSKSTGRSRPRTTVFFSPGARKGRRKSAPINVHMKQSSSGERAKSRESWIPEDLRRRMLKREFSVAKMNYEAREKCQSSSLKDLQRCKSDALENSRSKEKYGIELKRNCGLCDRPHLSENLVLAVTLKACLDIRDSWGCKYDPEGSSRVRVNPNLRKAPGCYNETRVCAFCAQLFDNQQEKYRPSWQAKVAEKKRIKDAEKALLEKSMSDPLAQIDKERTKDMSCLA